MRAGRARSGPTNAQVESGPSSVSVPYLEPMIGPGTGGLCSCLINLIISSLQRSADVLLERTATEK